MPPDARIPVLYLGWWREAAEALDRHGCRTMFVVGPADAGKARRGPAEQVVVVPDPTHLDDVAAGLARASAPVEDFAIVSTEYEQCIVPAALLAQAYGRRGLPVDTAVALRDKFVQKSRVRAAGLAVTPCWTVDSADDLRDVAVPFVVKPLSGAGTHLTYAVHDGRTLETAVVGITSSGHSGPWLVEEFVDGAELHVDGVVRAGTVRFLAVSRYLDNVIAIQRGVPVGSIVVDPAADPCLYQRVGDLTSASLGALGHTDGVFHLEAFDTSAGLVFGECAGRIGGGMIWETTCLKFGVDLYDEWARAVLDLPSDIGARRRADSRPYGWIQLSGRAGRVRSIPGLDDLRRQPGVVAAQVSLAPGDTVPDATAASHLRAGRVVMTDETEASLADSLRAFADWFQTQLDVVV